MDWIFDRFSKSPGLLAAAGLALLVAGYMFSDLPVMFASRNWPVTEGVILSQRIVAQQFREYDGDLYINVDVYLRYTYEVAGRSYSSTRLNAVNMYSYPKEIAENYHEGKAVFVFYHPRKPSLAVLEPGFVWSPQAFDVFTIIPAVAGLYLIGRGIKLGLAQKPKSL